MNIFNKTIIVLILLFLIVVSFVGIVNEFTGFFKWSDVALRVFDLEGDINPFVSVLALLMVIIICVFLLVMEFYRGTSKVAKIHGVKSGSAMITLDSIARHIKESAVKIEGVEDVDVKVKSKSGGIIIKMQAKLNQDVDVPQKMNEIINEAKRIANQNLGINVLKSNLTVVNLVSGKGQKVEEVGKIEEAEEAKGVSEEFPEQK